MKENNNHCEIDFSEEEEWVDYPYIGTGIKPKFNKNLSEDKIEKIIGG
jgi:hypothetical protein